MSIDLDERIIKGKKPLTAFDVMESKFIGTDCYFSDNASDYGDLSNCQIGRLLSRNGITGVFNATKNNSYANFNYCLPCEWVEEEQGLPKIDFESAKKDPNFEQCEIYGNELLYDTKNHVFYTSDGKIHFCLTHVAQRYAREEQENEVDVIAKKKYRPFSIEDWKFEHSFGDPIIYRYKGTYCGDHREVETMYLGYAKPLDGITDEAGKGELILGDGCHGLQNLFDNYEIWVDGSWQPFGFEVKDGE